jgi:hypothetical protein
LTYKPKKKKNEVEVRSALEVEVGLFPAWRLPSKQIQLLKSTSNFHFVFFSILFHSLNQNQTQAPTGFDVIKKGDRQ